MTEEGRTEGGIRLVTTITMATITNSFARFSYCPVIPLREQSGTGKLSVQSVRVSTA